MSNPIGLRSRSDVLAGRLAVGQAISSSHVDRWIDDLDWLNGYVLQPISSQTFSPVAAGTSETLRVQYTKNPGTDVVRIAIEASNGSSVASAGKLTVTCSGTIVWLSATNLFDGTHLIPATSTLFRDYPSVYQYADVSALTNGTTYDFTFAWADASTSNSKGLYAINITEMALNDCDPALAVATELGADLGAFLPRSHIIDGTTSTSSGLQRVLNELDRARSQNKRQALTLSAGEDTTNAWDVTTNTVATAFPFTSGAHAVGNNPTLRLRARSLYGSGNNTYQLRLRYMMDSTQTCTFRVAVTPVGGSVANTDYVLANGGAGTWTTKTTDNSSAQMTIPIPVTGTQQEADVQFFAWNSAGAVNTYFAQISLIENES